MLVTPYLFANQCDGGIGVSDLVSLIQDQVVPHVAQQQVLGQSHASVSCQQNPIVWDKHNIMEHDEWTHQVINVCLSPLTISCTSLLLLLPEYAPEPCKMATLKGGHHRWNSATHCCRTVAGHTIRTGPRPT